MWKFLSFKEKIQLQNALLPYLTENKRKRIEEVLKERTRYLTVVFEDIYQPHNASAVVRSCDCFGIQDLHLFEKRNRFQVNHGSSAGSAKWLDLYHYPHSQGKTLEIGIQGLKEKGYQIVATTLRPGALSLEALPIDRKLALCYGTEEQGLSEEAHALADCFVQLPMYGFTQSLNVSVTVALCLYELSKRLRSSSIHWALTEEEKVEIRLRWMNATLTHSEHLIQHFLEEQKKIHS
jgi:tRNA (guanosine-2'-O-)-methyltransferase